MYAGFGFRSSEIGDVEVLHHDGLYHLFHLVLPNHDFVAHAVSRDGIAWERVDNAIFISDPGNWDDDMLWTMSVSPDPHREGSWRMFYTGLSIRDNGRVQRIGMARSDDLYRWRKETAEGYPLELTGAPYEYNLDQGRHWVSFRDPYWVAADGAHYLVACARVDHGPVIRRGCVALFEEVEPDRFEVREPLFHPSRYDDVEVPTPILLDGRWYLIGSIREDVKVHYWYADAFEGPWYNHADNVLLPQNNYAARVCFDGDRWLVWNFFYKGEVTSGQHLLPPPKELRATEDGELYLVSFDGFDERVMETRDGPALLPPEPLFGLEHGRSEMDGEDAVFGCSSGFEVFLLEGEYTNFRFRGTLHQEGAGKTGLVLRLSDKGDGYYLSLDLLKGVAQLRAWGRQPGGEMRNAFHYVTLQTNFYVPHGDAHPFMVVAYGSYLEFSLDGRVLLTLSDETYRHGHVGFYTESAQLRLRDVKVERLHRPADEPYTEHTEEGGNTPGATNPGVGGPGHPRRGPKTVSEDGHAPGTGG